MEKCIKRKFAKKVGVQFFMRYAHNSRQPSNLEVVLHYHSTPEIYAVLTGVCRILLNNSIHLMQRGSLIWLAPGQVHVICERSFDCSFVMCSLSPQFLKEFGNQESLPLETKFFNLSEAEVSYLEHFFATIPPQNKPIRVSAIRYGADHLLRLLNREATTVQQVVLYPGIEKVLKLLMQEKEKPSLTQLAHLAAMSPTRFQQSFKAQMNMTFTEYWNKLQVRRFLAIYDAGKRYNLSEAVYQAGFGSYAQFYRIFTRITGYTPRAFQRICSSEGIKVGDKRS